MIFTSQYRDPEPYLLPSFRPTSAYALRSAIQISAAYIYDPRISIPGIPPTNRILLQLRRLDSVQEKLPELIRACEAVYVLKGALHPYTQAERTHALKVLKRLHKLYQEKEENMPNSKIDRYEITDTLTPYSVKVDGATVAAFAELDTAVGFLKSQLKVGNAVEIQYLP